MIQRACNHCGKTYETSPSINKQYCSAHCHNLARQKRTAYTCVVCGKESWYHASRPRIYCSRSCALTARNLTDKNPCYSRDVSGEKNPMYGKGMSGEANPMYGKRLEKSPRWKGGRKVRKDGYVLVVAHPDHPYGISSGHDSIRYILEHRYIMEQHIGRYLEPTEVVHHIDGNCRNNDISNLQLFASQAEHMANGHGKASR